VADPLVLQFDHREQKASDIGRLVGNGCASKRLADALAKCDIRCANCHRRRTAEASGWFRIRPSDKPELTAPARLGLN
jgi:hypothetical protein